MTSGLQFERAERPQGGLSCSLCHRAISETYYEANGKVVCPDCRAAIELEPTRGGSAGRFGRAFVLGVLAMVASSAVWYAVLKLTDSEWGIIAIVVGLFVGAAVRKGAERRGGWRYQALAMALTYAAIVFSYTPFVYEGAAQAAREQDGHATLTDTGAAAAADSGAGAARAPADSAGGVSAAKLAVGLLALAGVLFSAPIITGLRQPIGLLILAIALYEAWKLNKRLIVQIAGPFRVGAARAGP